MEEASSAQQGPFYVTNVLEINHEDLKVRASVSSIAFCFYLLMLASVPEALTFPLSCSAFAFYLLAESLIFFKPN